MHFTRNKIAIDSHTRYVRE